NLMRVYIDREKQERNGDLNGAVTFAEQALKDANASWAEAAAQLQAFQNRHRIADLDKATATQNDLVSQLETREHDAQATLDGTTAEQEVYKKALEAVPQTSTTTMLATNPQIAILQAQLGGLNADMQSMLQTLKPDHPKVKALAARIAATQAT